MEEDPKLGRYAMILLGTLAGVGCGGAASDEAEREPSVEEISGCVGAGTTLRTIRSTCVRETASSSSRCRTTLAQGRDVTVSQSCPSSGHYRISAPSSGWVLGNDLTSVASPTPTVSLANYPRYWGRPEPAQTSSGTQFEMRVGQTAYAYVPNWSGQSFILTWYRCDAVGGNCVQSKRITTSRVWTNYAAQSPEYAYALSTADVDRTLRYTWDAADGSTRAVSFQSQFIAPSAFSGPITTVAPPAFVLESGTAGAVGASYYVLPGTYRYGGIHAYYYYLCDAAGANCAPYDNAFGSGSWLDLTAAARGHTVRVRVTTSYNPFSGPQNGGFETGGAWSNPLPVL